MRVNAIAPGLIQTDFSQYYWKNEEFLRQLQQTQPIGRVGQPEEIGGLALYLASDEASYVTGQVFVIDGGATAADVQRVKSLACRRAAGLLLQQFLELLLGEDRNAQLAGFVQLAAGLFAGHDVIGLLRNARRGPAAVLWRSTRGSRRGCTCQRAGDDERLARQLSVAFSPGGSRGRHVDALAQQVVDRLPAELAVQKVVHALGDDRADLRRLGSVPRRVGLRRSLDVAEMLGQHRGHARPDVADRQRVEQPGQAARLCWPRSPPADSRPTFRPIRSRFASCSSVQPIKIAVRA